MKQATIVLTLFAALVASACSDGTVAPQVKRAYDVTSADLSKIARYKNGRPANANQSVSQVIGREGGRIEFAGFAADVPAGAVDSTVVFSIVLSGTDRAMASFLPHGLQFNVPVTLTTPYKNTDMDGAPSLHIMWFDGAQWLPLQSWITPDGKLQTTTTHFSDYGTEEDTTFAKGVTTVGG